MQKEVADNQEKHIQEEQNKLPSSGELSVYGTVNGIKSGSAWKSRAECSGAGVHKPTDIDIHVGPDGLYSLLLSRESEDIIDHGELISLFITIPIKDSKNENNGSDNQKFILSKNYYTGNPVRVVRTDDLRSPYAAKQGFRYDGLYIVERVTKKRIADDRQYSRVSFCLKRRANQSIPPWKLQNEVPQWNFMTVTSSPAKGLKNSSCRSGEKSSTNFNFSDSVYEHISTKEKLCRQNVTNSCMKTMCSVQRKSVTFKEGLIDNVERLTKRILVTDTPTPISKKPMNDAKSKSTLSNRLENDSSVNLSKNKKSNTELQGSTTNLQLIDSISASASSLHMKSALKEKRHSSDIHTEANTKEKSTDTAAKDNSNMQEAQDLNQANTYKEEKIITIGKLSSEEKTKTVTVQKEQANKNISKTKNTSLESSLCNRECRNICQAPSSEQKSRANEITSNKCTGEMGNDSCVELKDTSLDIEAGKGPQEKISNGVNNMQKQKQNSNHIKSMSSNDDNSKYLDSHLPKQDSMHTTKTKQNSEIESPCVSDSMTSNQNYAVEHVSFSPGNDFGKSVNSLCLQLSELESEDSTQVRNNTSSSEKKKFRLPQKQTSPLKYVKTSKHKAIPDISRGDRKRRKYDKKLVNSEMTSVSGCDLKKLTQLLNPADCNTFSRLKAMNCAPDVRKENKKTGSDVPHDMPLFKENNTTVKCKLLSNKYSTSVSDKQDPIFKINKLLPVVNLMRISDEQIKKFYNPKKKISSKQLARKRKYTSKKMKAKNGFRDCSVVLKRLHLPSMTTLSGIMDRDSVDSWYGWQVCISSLKNTCNPDEMTTLHGKTQVLGCRHNDIETHDITVPDELCEEPIPTDECWEGWNVVTAYVNIDNPGKNSNWFHGW